MTKENQKEKDFEEYSSKNIEVTSSDDKEEDTLTFYVDDTQSFQDSQGNIKHSIVEEEDDIDLGINGKSVTLNAGPEIQTKRRIYQCEICDREFDSFRGLRVHKGHQNHWTEIDLRQQNLPR